RFLNPRGPAPGPAGPRKSHLLRGETSHTATSSRIAAYSFPRAPNPSSHHQPPSAMGVPPRASVTPWKAVWIASSSLISCLRSPGCRHPPTGLTGRSSSGDREPRGSDAGQTQEAPRGAEPAFLQTRGQHEEQLRRDHRVVERLVGVRDGNAVSLGGRREALPESLIQRRDLDPHLPDVDRPLHPRAGPSPVETAEEADLDAREPRQEEPAPQGRTERLARERERGGAG